MFRNVPECSVFLVLSTAPGERVLIKYFLCFTWPSGNDMARRVEGPKVFSSPLFFFFFFFSYSFLFSYCIFFGFLSLYSLKFLDL